MKREMRGLLTWAAFGWTAIAASLVMSPHAFAQTNPFAGDARFLKQRTVIASGRTLNDMLADIGRETSIRFFVAASHREDKVIVYAHNRTLGDTLNAVAKLYGLEWKRSGRAPDFGYTLQQSPASAEAEAGEINAPLRTVIEQIRAETIEASVIEPLTREERNRQAETLAASIDPKSPKTSPPNDLRGLILRRSWDTVPALEPSYTLIRSLKPQELEDVVSNGATFHWPAATNRRLLPEAVFKQVRDLLHRSGSFSPEDDINFATIKLAPTTDQGIRLECTVSGGISAGASTSARHITIMLPLAVSAVSPTIAPMRPVFDWRSDKSLSQPIEIPDAVGLGTPLIAPPVPQPPLVTIIEALQKRAPFDVVADAFWTTDIGLHAQRTSPVGQILENVVQQCSHDCWIDNGFTLVRSRFFAADRLAEPPANAINRWIQRAVKEACTVDDYAEIASLPGRKLPTAVRILERAKLRDQASVIYQGQSALEFWNSLSRAQREIAMNAGLPYSDLPAPQRELFKAFSEERDRLRSQMRNDTSRSQEELVGMVFRAQIIDAPVFRAKRKEGSMMMSGTNADEVYEQLRSFSPGIKLSDITEMTLTTVTFSYGTSRRYSTRTLVRLPPRVKSN